MSSVERNERESSLKSKANTQRVWRARARLFRSNFYVLGPLSHRISQNKHHNIPDKSQRWLGTAQKSDQKAATLLYYPNELCASLKSVDLGIHPLLGLGSTPPCVLQKKRVNHPHAEKIDALQHQPLSLFSLVLCPSFLSFPSLPFACSPLIFSCRPTIWHIKTIMSKIPQAPKPCSLSRH